MSTENTEKRIEIAQRILALLKLAKDQGATRAEAETAAAMAAKLALKYAVSESDLAAVAPADAKMGTNSPKTFKRQRWTDAICHAVSKMFGVVWTYSTHFRDVEFHGQALDAELAAASADQLATRLRVALKQTGYKDAKEKRSWLFGAGHGVWMAVIDTHRQARTSTDSQALVVIDQKLAKANRFVNELMPDIKEARFRESDLDSSIVREGYAHGRTIELRKALA